MILQKNLLGLVFFFFLNLTFSQQKYLAIANEVLNEPTFVETAKTYRDTTIDVGMSIINIKNKKETEIYNFLEYTSISIKDTSSNFVIKSLPINSKNSDYAPSFYKGELIFASSRATKSFSMTLQGDTNEPFLDLFTTRKNRNKNKASKVKGQINTKFHESSATFSPDGKTIYFTRNNYTKGKFKRNTAGYVALKIYKADYDNGKWKNVEELPFTSDEYSIAHPSLSPDGRFLYFASDMPGSYGESDIYMVEIFKDGSYGTPQNLGNIINSAGRETFPYVSDKGTLFFASDGYLGYGGLDIFMVLPDENTGAAIYNMGAPINSPEDDFTFIINEENKIGYFASNRAGGKGGDDIYGFKQISPWVQDNQNMPKIKKRMEKHMKFIPKKEVISSF